MIIGCFISMQMSPQHLASFSVYSLIFTSFICIIFPACFGHHNEQYTICSSTFDCGKLLGIGYPFWGGDRPNFCGHDEYQLINCINNQYPLININEQTFRLVNIDHSASTMTIARNDLWQSICPQNFTKTYINPKRYAPSYRILSIFYGCFPDVIKQVQVPTNLTCYVDTQPAPYLNKGKRVDDRSATSVFFADNFLYNCSASITVPVLNVSYNNLWDKKLTLQEALKRGFDIKINAEETACSSCEASGGVCGSNSKSKFICLCRNKPHAEICPKDGINRLWKLLIGSFVAGIGVTVVISIICCMRSRKLSCKSVLSRIMKTNDHQNLEALIRNYGSLGPKRYSYSDVKKMTNSFKDKLGQGGYGGVYKGTLRDGHLVAVKLLNMSKGNGEDFVNEVASISRTSHVNIVSLFGFCLEEHRRALIYEFMPNGSLDQFIYSSSSPKEGGKLGWEKLYQIATGIARGLEYLHRGCTTQILHFDIKPHNILLDKDFCPKISDFGLSKLYNTNQSIVSMMGARGTMGYIAPEVFSRNFGGVSHKSDVYSYGMMLLEMVGGRKNIDVGVSHTSEIYFPQWVYKRLDLDEDLGLKDVVTREENDFAKKMVVVGLWCIHTDPLQRPSMKKVLDMLEGSINTSEIPPNPFLSSTRSAQSSSRA